MNTLERVSLYRLLLRCHTFGYHNPLSHILKSIFVNNMYVHKSYVQIIYVRNPITHIQKYYHIPTIFEKIIIQRVAYHI